MKKIARVLCAAWLAMCAATVMAQGTANFPTKTLRLIVNYTPGGPTDLVARTVAPKMSEALGQSVVVDNRPSASGAVGSEIAARSAPDGHTLLFSTSGHTSIIMALRGNKLPFDAFRDFSPVGLLVINTQIIVAHPSLGVKTLAELIKLAKAKPGQINFGSVGTGSGNHLGLELLKVMAGIDMVHIPYKGTAPVMLDLMAGRVQLMLNSMPTVLPFVKSGKLIALAVGNAQRSPAAPDIPTVAESGFPGYEVMTWYGVLTPVGTPREVITRLNSVINRTLNDPEVGKALATQGAEPAPGPPEQLARIMRDEYERWKKVIAAAKIEVE